jgi:hypothetical protein
MEIGNSTRIVRVEFGQTPFPQTVSNPLTQSCQGHSSCCQLHDQEKRAAHFAFLDSTKAQDAYAYFQYYKQLGR